MPIERKCGQIFLQYRTVQAHKSCRRVKPGYTWGRRTPARYKGGPEKDVVKCRTAPACPAGVRASYDGARKPSEELSSEGPHGAFIKFTLNSLCNIHFITLGQFLSISGVDSAASLK